MEGSHFFGEFGVAFQDTEIMLYGFGREADFRPAVVFLEDAKRSNCGAFIKAKLFDLRKGTLGVDSGRVETQIEDEKVAILRGSEGIGDSGFIEFVGEAAGGINERFGTREINEILDGVFVAEF